MDGQASEGRGWWWDGLSHRKLQRLSITLWKQEKVCIVLMQKKSLVVYGKTINNNITTKRYHENYRSMNALTNFPFSVIIIIIIAPT